MRAVRAPPEDGLHVHGLGVVDLINLLKDLRNLARDLRPGPGDDHRALLVRAFARIEARFHGATAEADRSQGPEIEGEESHLLRPDDDLRTVLSRSELEAHRMLPARQDGRVLESLLQISQRVRCRHGDLPVAFSPMSAQIDEAPHDESEHREIEEESQGGRHGDLLSHSTSQMPVSAWRKRIDELPGVPRWPL